MHFLPAMLATFFTERARETQMEIFAGGMNGAVRTRAVATVDPCAVTLVTEDV